MVELSMASYQNTIRISRLTHSEANALDRDKAEFSRCIKECTKSLYQLAMRFTQNNADAEDLVAESVEKAWLAFASLDDRSRFRPWIMRILHNSFVSKYRKKIVRPAETSYNDADVDGDEKLVSLLLNQPDDFLVWWANPEREFANRLLGRDIENAIESLPEAYRVAVMLVNVEGLSYDEAANVLGVPPGTIHSRMKRGRTLLQKALWQHAKDAGIVSSSDSKGAST